MQCRKRAEDAGSSPGSGRSPGEGNGNPLQYSCLENPMDRGACWVTVHGVTKSGRRLITHPSYLCCCCCSVAQSCLTLCDSMDCNPTGSSDHGIFQARILQWVAIPFSRESSQLRERTPSPALQQIFHHLSHICCCC